MKTLKLIAAAAVPEPGTYALLASGLLIAASRRRSGVKKVTATA